MPKKSNILFLILLSFFIALPAQAQSTVSDDYPIVKLRSLDKITAQTETFEANVGSTVKFGPLFIKVQACRKAPPIETPESAAFLQIWEVSKDGKTKEEDANWVFSGWMFASSPGLSSMDHAIYDVWVLDCLGDKIEKPEGEEAVQSEETEVQEQPSNEVIREELPVEDEEEAIEEEVWSEDEAAQ
jgi:hypothetical protein